MKNILALVVLSSIFAHTIYAADPAACPAKEQNDPQEVVGLDADEQTYADKVSNGWLNAADQATENMDSEKTKNEIIAERQATESKKALTEKKSTDNDAPASQTADDES